MARAWVKLWECPAFRLDVEAFEIAALLDHTQLEPGLRGALLSRRVRWARQLGRTDEAERLEPHAWRAIEATEDPDTRVYSMFQLGSRYLIGDRDADRPVLEACRELLPLVHDRQIHALVLSALTNHHMDETVETELIEGAIAHAQHVDLGADGALILASRGYLEKRQGDFDAAEASFVPAVELALEQDATDYACYLGADLAISQVLGGRPRSAIPVLASSVSLAGRHSTLWGTVGLLGSAALCFEALGHDEPALLAAAACLHLDAEQQAWGDETRFLHEMQRRVADRLGLGLAASLEETGARWSEAESLGFLRGFDYDAL